VSIWLIDRVGRRPLLLTGIAGMMISLGALGFVFHGSAISRGFADFTGSLARPGTQEITS
jgi:MFS family permease